jgi:hypothetical protein
MALRMPAASVPLRNSDSINEVFMRSLSMRSQDSAGRIFLDCLVAGFAPNASLLSSVADY